MYTNTMELVTRSFFSTFPSLRISWSSPKLKLINLTPCSFLRRNSRKTPSTNNIPLLYSVFNVVDEVVNTYIDPVVDEVVNTYIDPPSRPSVDPKLVLSNNFAPVLDELPPTECELLEGSIPPCLDGVYIRNGPNPQFIPRGPYHLLDGDGMLHAIRITNGRATLCSHYVKTYKYTVERDAGSPLLPNVFSGFNVLTAFAARGGLTTIRTLAGQINPMNGIGLANTSLALIGNRLFALGESDLPYELNLTHGGDIETIGRYDFDGKLGMSMTAHPKVDPDTKEAFAFRYGPVPPFLTYFRFDCDGNKGPDVPIFSTYTASFMHDFAITKKFAVFTEIQIGMKTNPLDMIIRRGSPMEADPGKISRIGVIPLYAPNESEMRWFDVPGFNIVHAINAWDEEDEDGAEVVTMVAPNVLSVEHALERVDLVHALVEKVRINLRTGIVSRHPISVRNLDLATINPTYVGKPSRYVYAAIGDPTPKISGVVKLDVEKGKYGESAVACRMYGERCYGGEPFFVSREPENKEAEEDDGYVVSYVHDEKNEESKFLVMDAKSPELEVVAVVKLPRRVPYGFHGLFVSKLQISKLKLTVR